MPVVCGMWYMDGNASDIWNVVANASGMGNMDSNANGTYGLRLLVSFIT